MNERNLLADTAKIVEKNKVCKRKDDICRTVVTDLLFALGYDASVCKSRWEKTPSYPAGTLSLPTPYKNINGYGTVLLRRKCRKRKRVIFFF